MSQYEDFWSTLSNVSEAMNKFAGEFVPPNEETRNIEYALRLNVLMALIEAMGELPRPKRVWKFRITPRRLSESCQRKAEVALGMYSEYKKTYMDPWRASNPA